MLFNEMYQHLENLQNSVNQNSSNDQCMMLQYYTWVKYSSKVQDRSVDFKATKFKKFIDMVSDSTFYLIFKKTPFDDF